MLWKNESSRALPRGQSLVEMAIALPLLIVIVFGIIDFGALFSSYNGMREAATAGARLAAVDNECFPGSPDFGTARCPAAPAAQLANLKTDTIARSPGLATASVSVRVCYDEATVGTSSVTVEVSYPARSLTGFFGWLFTGTTLTADGVMPLEHQPTYEADAPAC